MVRVREIDLASALIDSILQYAGAFKGNHPPAVEHHVFAGSGISASAFILFLYAEFAKTADENVLTGFKSYFDDVEKVFNQLCAAFA